jgi:hypothetical protein
LLNPAKHAFRQSQGWGDFDKVHASQTRTDLPSPREALASWADALESTWLSDREMNRHAETTANRLNYLSIAGRTFEYAGNRVPFDRGARWHLILDSLVPRALNPSKPNMTREFNDRFNYLFGIQSAQGTRSTTVGLPLLADGYWNFAWLGVVMAALVGGLYWGFVAELWSPRLLGVSWLAMVLLVRCGPGASLYGYVAGVPSIVIGLAAVQWGLYAVSSLISRIVASSGLR